MNRKAPKPTESDILESAIALVEGTLALNILDRHKRDVMNGMLWSITQARGKYSMRFQSAAAMNAPKGTKLQHEHVIPRKELIAAIMKEPNRARELLTTAVACTVTVEEHRRLSAVTRAQPDLKGWARYDAAGIVWKDRDSDRDE
jgi:hypothetical protein